MHIFFQEVNPEKKKIQFKFVQEKERLNEITYDVRNWQRNPSVLLLKCTY